MLHKHWNVLPRLRDAKIDDVGRDDMQRMHKLLRARSLSPKNMSGVLKILEAFISVMPPLEISHDNPYAHEAEEAMLFGQKEVQELLRSCFGNPACPAPG
mmetsp:Transcript_5541/g.13518  ORF Transcript_5541/g.13518 Transcript_5541/m.13518 type:complete len:100 (+) Transcript_5541:777-1076(+)